MDLYDKLVENSKLLTKKFGEPKTAFEIITRLTEETGELANK
jgi:hypothetical protein